MQYRKFGKLDWKVSALGFGCMRLPTRSQNPADIDEPEATRMIRYAIDHGVNYIDTAYPYHGGNSEPFLGRALQGGYRAKIRLATKLPCWLVQSASDFDRYLNEQLQRLQTDHIDFYLLHSLNKAEWTKVRDLGVLSWAEKAIADGRIGYLGFSFHDEYPVFQKIVDAYDRWTFCQIQYNYMDINHQAGTKGLHYAASKGLAVVVMEPLLGGRLVNPPEPVQKIWESAPKKRTPADWALQWLWNQPEVSVVLSGMSTMQQVEENLASADRSGIGILSQEELDIIARVRAKYNELCPIPCTACGYCMPCPSGVDIPRVFRQFNYGAIYNAVEEARSGYQNIPEQARADKCSECHQCEELCPQHIPISTWMKRVDQVLAHGRPYEECLL
ncbi:MAG: aldo/keto reductase [Chloroflexi bacterium]|nr:aldo/keto reductase [Chloroflexota bacterium]